MTTQAGQFQIIQQDKDDNDASKNDDEESNNTDDRSFHDSQRSLDLSKDKTGSCSDDSDDSKSGNETTDGEKVLMMTQRSKRK